MSKPSEKYSQPVLDSVLSDSGAMPAARLGIRLQALILDCVFVILFSLIAIGQFALPQAFPNVYTEGQIHGAQNFGGQNETQFGTV